MESIGKDIARVEDANKEFWAFVFVTMVADATEMVSQNVENWKKSVN